MAPVWLKNRVPWNPKNEEKTVVLNNGLVSHVSKPISSLPRPRIPSPKTMFAIPRSNRSHPLCWTHLNDLNESNDRSFPKGTLHENFVFCLYQFSKHCFPTTHCRVKCQRSVSRDEALSIKILQALPGTKRGLRDLHLCNGFDLKKIRIQTASGWACQKYFGSAWCTSLSYPERSLSWCFAWLTSPGTDAERFDQLGFEAQLAPSLSSLYTVYTHNTSMFDLSCVVCLHLLSLHSEWIFLHISAGFTRFRRTFPPMQNKPRTYIKVATARSSKALLRRKTMSVLRTPM